MPSKTTKEKKPLEVKLIQGKRIHFKIKHPLAGPNEHFDSWMCVCERAVELAEAEASTRLYQQFEDLVIQISDQIMSTVEEYEPEEVD